MNNFTIVGTLHPIAASETFVPYEEKNISEKWTMRRFRTRIQSGGSSFFLENNGGCNPNGNGTIYTYCNGIGNTTIPWKARFTDPNVGKVAGFKKWVIDLYPFPQERTRIKRLLKDLKENNKHPDPAVLKELGLNTEDDLLPHLKELNELRKDFIAEWDFIMEFKKLVDGGAFNDKVVRIDGDTEYTKSKKGDIYKSYKPKRVQIVPKDADVEATEVIDFYWNEDCVQAIDDESKQFQVNGWVRSYYKDYIYPKYAVIVRTDGSEKDRKKFETIHDIFDKADEEIYTLPLVIRMVNGTEEKTLTFDDLTDELKEMVELDLMTERDAIQSMTGGKKVAGDRITENRLLKFRKATPTVTTFKSEIFGTSDLENDDLFNSDLDTDDTDDLFGDDDSLFD